MIYIVEGRSVPGVQSRNGEEGNSFAGRAERGPALFLTAIQLFHSRHIASRASYFLAPLAVSSLYFLLVAFTPIRARPRILRVGTDLINHGTLTSVRRSLDFEIARTRFSKQRREPNLISIFVP